MKYMGSKRAMLENGLGQLLRSSLKGKGRFVDLFCGSGAVSTFVAGEHALPVVACDLQHYAVTLTSAIITRTKQANADEIWSAWSSRAVAWMWEDGSTVANAKTHTVSKGSSRTSGLKWVKSSREFCSLLSHRYPFTRAYGGYYFSVSQGLAIDALRATADDQDLLSIAALISASSRCAAAPGHTAQPFSTASSSLPHLLHAWRRDVFAETKQALLRISALKARRKGFATVGDALDMTRTLKPGDLVFVDPPYSEVQYSRFYHVLEAVCVGSVSSVTGTGRYPPLIERPQSNYCKSTAVIDEFDRLMLGIACRGVEAIVTFPAGLCSNGLSGDIVEALSRQYFKVRTKKVASVFSTLGGNASNRSARQGATELMLHLSPL